MKYEYDTELQVMDDGGAYVVFPWDIRKEFGKGRVRVHAEFDGIPYDGSIVNMGVKNHDGFVCYIIGVLKSIRKQLNKTDGDIIHVSIEEYEMTIEEYIEKQDTDIKPRLYEIYETIRTVIPEAEERYSYGMPTFWKGRNIIHFAAMKNHIGIYPGSEAIEAFADKLKGYKTSKGAIQFPNNENIPLELISEIADWCYRNNRKD
jgi:uncharacterized protein YdhG (YjbR/CyaY superfamily)